MILDIQQLPTFFLNSFQSSPVPTIVSSESFFMHANHAFLKQFEYSHDEIVSLNFDVITPENTTEKPHIQYFNLNDILIHRIDERYIIKKGGSVVLIELSYVTHLFQEQLFNIFFVRDISVHKTKNQKLYENEKRLSLALNASSQAIWDWNNITGETYYSDQYFEMLGYNPNEFIPSYEKWILLLHPEDKEIAPFAQQMYLDGTSNKYEIDFRLQKKDNTYIWTHTRAIILSRNAKGVPERIIGVVMDIDNAKKKEIRLHDITQKLIEFSFYHSHVLRGPIARALGLLELIRLENNTDYWVLLDKTINEVDDIIIKMNPYLINETNKAKQYANNAKCLIFVSTDKLSQFIYEKYITNLEIEVNQIFDFDLSHIVDLLAYKTTLENILIIDIQSFKNDIWNYMEEVYRLNIHITIFILTDSIAFDEIVKAKNCTYIKGILLKPLTKQYLLRLFT